MPLPVPSISHAEWEVMEVVWKQKSVTAEDIVRTLGTRRKRSPRTVKSLLSRLVAKKAIGHELDGTRYAYHSRVDRDRCVRIECQAFLRRVFAGKPAALLTHFAQSSRLTPAEQRQLRKALRESNA
jgi:BlaI family transcriptional regulator, penicillinase repressor